MPMETFAAFLVEVRARSTSLDLEVQEAAREFCRAVSSLRTGPVTDSLRAYWVALTRAKVGNPSDASVTPSSLGAPTSKAKGLPGLARNLESMTPAAFDALREDFRLFIAAVVQLREAADTWMMPDAREHVEDLEDTIAALRPLFEV